MSQKRQLEFSCQLCYRRKVKCDRGNPCSYCVRQKVDCIPSPVETHDRPRKQRFPEAELLKRINKYEKALLSYGADLEAIRAEEGKEKEVDSPEQDVNAPKKNFHSPLKNPHFEVDQVLTILDGGGTASVKDTFGSTGTIPNYLDQVFENDGSSMFFAVETKDIPLHPNPFDIFRLWQVYCDNIHPLNKTLHAPTFQRKISSYGTHLNLAPAADQALFFAVYSAALSSLSPQECEAMFFSTRQSLLDQYQYATQIWLRRAGVWRTSDLVVLQAYVLLLSTLHNVIDPRTLVSFTAMADRIGRRMGIHRPDVRSNNAVDKEMRKRVWWEIILQDARTAEKAGMGSSFLVSHWSIDLPSDRSDLDLESLDGVSMKESSQPASEMIFCLIRAETARLMSKVRSQQAPHGDSFVDSAVQVPLARNLKSIDDFERHITSKYLSLCDNSLIHHRMTISVAQMTLARLRLSIYVIEEAFRQESQKYPIQMELLKQCTITLEHTNKIRSDPSLQKFQYFIFQHMPIFAFIHILRLLQIHTIGSPVDRAWKAVQGFKEKGLRFPADSLIMKAWKSRQASLPPSDQVVPDFIRQIEETQRQAFLSSQPSSAAAITADTFTSLASTDLTSSKEKDFMALLAEMSNNVEFDFDWSSWLNESSSSVA